MSLRYQRAYSSSSDSEEGLDSLRIAPYSPGSNTFDTEMHAMLCGRKSRKKAGADGFQEVERQSKPGKGHSSHMQILRKGGYDPEMVERFTRIYNDCFYAMTGRKLDNFRLTASTHKYVSMLEFARGRDRVLATMFERRPVVWDLMAGSGSDALSFLLNLDPAELVACQRSVSDGETNQTKKDESFQEYQVMCENIKSFLRAYGQVDAHYVEEDSPMAGELGAGFQEEPTGHKRTVVKCKHKLAETYIMSVPDNTEVDIVYLDPSWDDAHDVGGTDTSQYELQPSELFQRLEDIIWGPIRRKKIKVGCYVIKTRWNWLKVQTYMQKVNTDFIAEYSVRAQPFRPHAGRPGKFGERQGVYHYMILTHKQYKTISLNNSQLYWDIVYNNQPVWVEYSSVVGIQFPEYSTYSYAPSISETDPHDERRYFKIEPVPPLHGKQRERVVARTSKGESSSYAPDTTEAPPPPARAPAEPGNEAPNDIYTYRREDNRYGPLPDNAVETRLKAAARPRRGRP
jgi:hypothetical protein